MQTQYAKESILKMKNAIKTKVAEQKVLKNQRKTVNLVGNRIVSEHEAALRHIVNREWLRYHYLAYAILRGKSIENMEPKNSKPYSQSGVQKIVDSYGQVVCTDEK